MRVVLRGAGEKIAKPPLIAPVSALSFRKRHRRRWRRDIAWPRPALRQLILMPACLLGRLAVIVGRALRWKCCVMRQRCRSLFTACWLAPLLWRRDGACKGVTAGNIG